MIEDSDSSLELVEDDSDDGRDPRAAGVEFLRAPPPDQGQSFQPLRTFDPHAAPETWAQVLVRGIYLGVLNPVIVLYAGIAWIPLLAQRVPWVDHPLPWPGQSLTTYLMCYTLLERARAAKWDERETDVLEMGSVLLRALLFLFPLALGVGSMPASAYAVIPVLLLFFPLLLGALASDVWGEFWPRALWAAFMETPNYLATAVLSGVALAIATFAVWYFPDGQAFPRGAIGVVGYALAGGMIGAARRDAELLGDADPYYSGV